MTTFSKSELDVIDLLASGDHKLKKSKLSEETLGDRVSSLKAKLDAKSTSEIPERFKSLTGWSGKPSDYPQ